MTPRRQYVNWRFGSNYHFYLHGSKSAEQKRSVLSDGYEESAQWPASRSETILNFGGHLCPVVMGEHRMQVDQQGTELE
jgi:hypothetical protein